MILFTAQDNWHHYHYSQRFADSFAGILNFQDPCCALCYLPTQNLFVLSYNKEPTTATLNKIDEALGLISEMIKTSDRLIQKKLLSFYLVFSQEFKTSLRLYNNSCKNLDKDVKSLIIELIKQLNKAAECLEDYYDPLKSQKRLKEVISSHKSNKIEDIEKLRTHLTNLCDVFEKEAKERFVKFSNVFCAYQNLFKLIQTKTTGYIDPLTPEEIELNKIIFRPKQDIIKLIHNP